MDDKTHSNWITMIACCTLAATVMAMVIVFVFGFFDDKVDNKELFQIVGPAFQTIIGGFIGLITGIKIGRNQEENKP
jgi:undecaprenyl pyrophosphate phosphatase UppP